MLKDAKLVCNFIYMFGNFGQQHVFHCVGPPGKQGKPGPRRADGIKGDSGGVVYTRWGRSDCPKSGKTTMLYSGAGCIKT